MSDGDEAMSIRSVVIAREQVIRSGETAYIQPKRPLLVSVTLFVVFVSTMLVFGVVMAARTQAIPPMPNLPKMYLPGNSIPNNISCYWSGDEHIPRCSIRFDDHEAYFGIEPDWNFITQAFIPARDYTIGQLLTDWGTPTGITHRATMVYVHWGLRSALIYTHDFQPDDPVEFIIYDLEPVPASPWRGFRLFK
jgi:hypothetical protein